MYLWIGAAVSERQSMELARFYQRHEVLEVSLNIEAGDLLLCSRKTKDVQPFGNSGLG